MTPVENGPYVTASQFALHMISSTANYRGADAAQTGARARLNNRVGAALAWAEAVTLLSESHVPDDVYQLAREQFNEGELVDLTVAVTTINSWNRLAVSFRQTPSD